MAKIKTKFDSLVKLKKLKIDEKENNILKLNISLQNELQNLSDLKSKLIELQLPEKGNFALINQYKIIEQLQIREINQKKTQIEFIKNQLNNLKEELKNANLEYEKIKYLQSEEIKNNIKRLKQEEAKNMDEIALLLYKG